MKVKFYSEPNLYVKISNKVIQRMSNLKGFTFDEKGEYITENAFIINAMKAQFKYEEVIEITEQPEVIDEPELPTNNPDMPLDEPEEMAEQEITEALEVKPRLVKKGVK